MKASKAGIVSALLASACCIGPLLLIAIGLGTGAAFLGRYHWFFLVGGLAVLTWAWVKYLREKTVCDCEHRPMDGGRSGMVTLVMATVFVLGFAALNISRYVFASPVPSPHKVAAAEGMRRVVIPVEGMTCAACEIAIRRALARVPGVKSAAVSVASNSAEVEFDPDKATTADLIKAVDSTGYKASAPRNQ